MRVRLPLVLVGILAVAFFSAPPPKKQRAPTGAPMLPRLEVLRIAGAGQLAVLADFFWIRTIHQVGLAKTGDEYRDVFYYADLVTNLDPDYRPVYSFAAIAIPHNLGRERWVNIAESTHMLEKGLRRYPDDYQLLFMRAYNLLFLHRDYARAARELKRLSEFPWAPFYLRALAIRVAAHAGEFETSRQMAEALRDSAEDPQTRAFFEGRLRQIELEEVLQRVDKASEAFQQREGRIPKSVEELLGAGLLAVPPIDPTGGRIGIDALGHAKSAGGRLQLLEEYRKQRLWEAEHAEP